MRNFMPFSEAISKLIELPTKGFWQVLRIFFIIISSLMAAGMIYILYISEWFHKRYGYDLSALLQVRALRADKMAKRWQRIKARLNKADEAEHKLAVIEAENFLIEVLTARGFKEETLLEQLEKMGSDALSPEKLDKLLEAHQIRSNVVHDPDYQLSLDIAKKTVDIFEKTLQELAES